MWGAARRRRARRHAVSQWPRLQFTLIAIMWYRSCRILKKCDDFLKKQKGSAKRPDLPAEPCEPQPAGGPAAVPLPRGYRAPPARKTILKKSEYSNGLAVGGAAVGVRSFEQRTSLASSQTPRFRFNQALAGWLEAGWRADAVCVRRPPHVNSSNSFFIRAISNANQQRATPVHTLVPIVAQGHCVVAVIQATLDRLFRDRH